MISERTAVMLLTAVLSLCMGPPGSSADDFADQRQKMVDVRFVPMVDGQGKTY